MLTLLDHATGRIGDAAGWYRYRTGRHRQARPIPVNAAAADMQPDTGVASLVATQPITAAPDCIDVVAGDPDHYAGADDEPRERITRVHEDDLPAD